MSAVRALAVLERAAETAVDPSVLYELHAERVHLERCICACNAALHRLVRITTEVSNDEGARRWLCEAEFGAYVNALWPPNGRVDLPSPSGGATVDNFGVMLHDGLYDAARHALDALLMHGERSEAWSSVVDAEDVRGFLLHATFHELRELATLPFALIQHRRCQTKDAVDATDVERPWKTQRLSSLVDGVPTSTTSAASGSSVYYTTYSSSSQSSAASRSSASSYHSTISNWEQRLQSEEGENGKAIARRFTELQLAVEAEASLPNLPNLALCLRHGLSAA